MEGGGAVLPFVRMFYGSRSEYLWEDNEGNVHSIPQEEGGEQGDTMMPLLFCLGQQEVLQAVQRQLQAGERLFVHLDDVHVVTRPHGRGGGVQDSGGSFECVLLHSHPQREDEDWNKSGVRPVACDRLERIAQVENPRATLWKGGGGAHQRTRHQGVLGPLGHDDFVAHHLREVAREQQELLDKIPLVKDLQSAWLLLLQLRSSKSKLPTQISETFSHRRNARTHDEGVWQCLANLGTDLGQCTEAVRELATLPLRLGGLGLTSAVRIRGSAHLGSWADCLPVIHERHPEVAGALLEQLNEGATLMERGGSRGTSRRSRPGSTQAMGPASGLAERSSIQNGIVVDARVRLPKNGGICKSFSAITRESRSWSGFESMPHLQTDTVGAATLPGPLAPSPIDSVRAFLPVRPPNRPIWPPPRCLCTGRDSGQEEICS